MSARYIYRTKKADPSAYEQALARAIYKILESNTHGLAEIVRELNKGTVRPPSAEAWTEQSFAAEMERLGQWPNSIGGALGSQR
jgi:hypothetical protein